MSNAVAHPKTYVDAVEFPLQLAEAIKENHEKCREAVNEAHKYMKETQYIEVHTINYKGYNALKGDKPRWVGMPLAQYEAHKDEKYKGCAIRDMKLY